MTIDSGIADIPIIILAGGLGKRLGKISEELPKAMFPFHDHPFIHYQLISLKSKGFRKVIICVGHLGENISQYVGNGSQYGLTVTYSNDGGDLLGTGGAVRKVCRELNTKCFITYGDTLLLNEFDTLLSVFNGQASMMIYQNNNMFDTSNVSLKNNTIVYSKLTPPKSANFIDYGVSLVASELLEPYPKVFDLARLFENLSSDHRLSYAIANKTFYEIGTKKAINRTNLFLKQAGKNLYGQ